MIAWHTQIRSAFHHIGLIIILPLGWALSSTMTSSTKMRLSRALLAFSWYSIAWAYVTRAATIFSCPLTHAGSPDRRAALGMDYAHDMACMHGVGMAMRTRHAFGAQWTCVSFVRISRLFDPLSDQQSELFPI